MLKMEGTTKRADCRGADLMSGIGGGSWELGKQMSVEHVRP